MIDPHGGTLVNRILTGEALDAAVARAAELPKLMVPEEIAGDARNLARGVFSPLDGFVGREQFEGIVNDERLPDGTIYTIPIFLTVDDADAVAEGDEVVLCSQAAPDKPVALMSVEEVFAWDKAAAESVFGTADMAHPGVAGYHARGDYIVGGPVDLIDNDRGPFAQVNLFPAETREFFESRGWRTVCAFQTRNVPHAGHEDLQKTVLGLCDGLMIQPIIGKKKSGDFQDAVIIAAYEALIGSYFHPDRVFLNILPTEMRYAGPKEAIFHGIMRKNYGCTHIIIGRDHAGVGNYYGEEEAIEKFEAMAGELGILPITIRGDFWYCCTCGRVASNRTCPHEGETCLSFSGTEIRTMIVDGTPPRPEIMRTEVFEIIRQFDQPFVQ
ncbi:MAG: sulfate adenylyltransferase [Armatimonadota bacterium]|jgi:sulfate adenylyltransferase